MKKKLKSSSWFGIMILLLLFQYCTSKNEKDSNSDNKKLEEKVVYTCPMPEDSIFSEKPGSCPKCGMDLVKMEHSHNEVSNKETAPMYTCPMHPEVVKNEPSKCPICGMDLVEKIQNQNAPKLGLGDIVKPANELVLSSIKTIKPQNRTLSGQIEAMGYITYNPKNTKSIASRYAGRIEKLYVKYNFEEIYKGQKLLEIYSPELVTAQENLLLTLKTDPENQNLIKAAKDKLLFLGMSTNQINEVMQSLKVKNVVSVFAPMNGHIHEMKSLSEISMPIMEMGNQTSEMSKSTNNGEFSTREGMYVEKGQTIFSVIGTEKLWAILKIYPEDVAKIKLKQKVEIYSEMQSEKVYEEQIDFIEPTFESDSKYLNARVYLENCDHHQLKIGSLIKAKIKTQETMGIWIPKESVLDLGNNQHAVFIKQNGVFKTHEVSIDDRNGNWIKLKSGLALTDEIAQNAQYLIDSEGFIKLK